MSAGDVGPEVRFPLAEGPGFLKQVFVEREDDGTICLGVYNNRGDPYAYSRIQLGQFLAALAIVCPEGIPDADDPLRRDRD